MVNFLTGIGVDSNSIIFTSDTNYGIPAGENIFNWLKTCISERPFVIYLLSPEYYSSVACLNEMGAAWVIESKHRIIFTPDFDIASDNFKNGALDPREMGFFVNDKDRLTEFAEFIKNDFKLTTKQILVNRKIDEFMDAVKAIPTPPKAAKPPTPKVKTEAPNIVSKADADHTPTNPIIAQPKKPARGIKQSPVERYFQDLANGKLKDEEVMIVYYAADTVRHKLGVGWKADKEEVPRIQDWEALNDLGDTLSKGYATAISRLELRKLTEVSETTSFNNPREVKLIEELKDKLLDLPDSFYQTCDEIVRVALENKQESNDYLF